VFILKFQDANHLIEEFMLLANKKVAEFIGKQRKFIYRIHDEQMKTNFCDASSDSKIWS
jgi:exoribonuclease R